MYQETDRGKNVPTVADRAFWLPPRLVFVSLQRKRSEVFACSILALIFCCFPFTGRRLHRGKPRLPKRLCKNKSWHDLYLPVSLLVSVSIYVSRACKLAMPSTLPTRTLSCMFVFCITSRPQLALSDMEIAGAFKCTWLLTLVLIKVKA